MPDWRRRLRPAALPAALLAGGIAIGGLPGFLAGFVAALLGIDRLLDRMHGSGGWGMADAGRRFDRLVRERRRRPSRCAYLPEDTGPAATAKRRRVGVEPIPVASIVGTVDPHKAEAFDAEFRPPPYGRVRWSQMCHAVQAGAELPPISVYRFQGRHYVRDGHHRVSVARALGATDIDADVTELTPAGGVGRT
ncbi:MAG TPA: ParB/RepB/Spo0J family partition protein [Solirubrobacteraceae bacterium]|nr:ParB/RepB/Spo0J family partition protein [Solirubrobacteraceae bacterium]